MSWGVALSGGGVPGIAAHLGFLAELEAWGFSPPVVVGASAGGIVAGSLGAGMGLQPIFAGWGRLARAPWALLAREAFHFLEFLRPGPAPGMLHLLPAVLAATGGLAEVSLQDWRPGYGVVVSDLTNGDALVLSQATPQWTSATALAASGSFPPVFAGIRGPDGHLYCDGGLYADVPVSAARVLGASKVLAVRIGVPRTVPQTLTLATYAQVVLSRIIAAADRSDNPTPPDLEVAVPVQGGLLALDCWDADVAAGHAAALGNKEAILALAGA